MKGNTIMIHEQAIPVVACSLIEPEYRGDGYRLQVIICPYCGQSHWHGAGEEMRTTNTGPRHFGHRVAHCDTPLVPNRAGYILHWDGQMRGKQRTVGKRRR